MLSLTELLERDCVVQMESSIPSGMTIADWRRTQARRVEARRGRRRLRVFAWSR